jgi:hypothetical protein
MKTAHVARDFTGTIGKRTRAVTLCGRPLALTVPVTDTAEPCEECERRAREIARRTRDAHRA